MPHATAPHNAEDDQDQALIDQVLDAQNPLDFNRDLEPGEKADDAEDYEDIGDDDLADDEDATNGQDLQRQHEDGADQTSNGLDAFMRDEGLQGLTSGNAHEDEGLDDLFGDHPSPPRDANDATGQPQLKLEDADDLFDFGDSVPLPAKSQPPPASQLPESQASASRTLFQPVTLGPQDAPFSKEQQLQQQLFAESRLGLGQLDVSPAPPGNQEEVMALMWPKFERNTVPRFMDLLPPKRARYVGKKIPKPPKPLNPTKVSLELAQDQEKSFKVSSAPSKRTHEDTEELEIINIRQETVDEKTDEENVDMESDFEEEAVGGVSWQDLQIICEDWDTRSLADSIASDEARSRNDRTVNGRAFGDFDDDPDHGVEWPSAKRRKLDRPEVDLMQAPQFSFPSFQDPEYATSKIAKTITLDLNDSQLLMDHVQASVSRNAFGRSDLKKAGRGALAKGLSQRYNISNDEAYEQLKENHQSKVRSMLGNIPVEHSLPAVRLQWPLYKTKLDKHEARSFHRPTLKVNRNEQITMAKPQFVKRKHLKARNARSIFHGSKDLTLADNSNVLLLEYSEEYPTMMSNVGMGNRVINYYRRKTTEDTSRPKLDIGETAVLLPQDKSPFSMFGHFDPGQTTPALYNGMYRAPIFKQEPKNTDFMIIKTTTGVHGTNWSVRGVDHLYAVGQEFPSVDVPGPHSRKVTTAAKNRLKMISYRLIRRSKSHRLSVSEVTSHFADTTDMQNRQKMKEFMKFNKEHKEWQMNAGETVPDEETVRTMVKPEDVCLLESMQVGQQHLHDAGFNKEDDNSEEDDSKEGQSIEQQLAPWYTSRNFLHATQGKAMLALHGEGDPSGRGEAFSFIKTSMKGGFKAAGASASEKMHARHMKDSGGHAYNVQEQQKSYEESIRRIWEAQKQSLSATVEQSDSDMDEDPVEEASKNAAAAATPHSEAQTPATLRRRDDETMSQFTQHSTGSQSGKILRITRNGPDEYGNPRPIVDIIRDPKVIRQYLRRRHAKEDEATGVHDLVPTDDPEQNRRRQQKLQKELDRLQRNKERRIARDKQKGVHFDGPADDAGSPSSPVAGAKTAGTQRKCANCGQVGHIKTNKKLCPMLNGTMKPEEGFSNSAFTMGTPAP